MTDVNHVIEAIDNALNDWAVSDDAMRWTPEPVPGSEGCDFGPWTDVGVLNDGQSLNFAVVDETHYWQEAELRPLMEQIRRDVRVLAAAAEVPVWVLDLEDSDATA